MTAIFWTARAAVILYVASLLAQIASRPRVGRWAWTVGCLVLWIHFMLAMQWVYRWDFALLARETTRQSAMLTGVALGFEVYFNFALVTIWAVDAVYWQLWGDWKYQHRVVWISISVHVFIAFMMFNSVVVFARTPWLRIAGLAACFALIVVAWAYHRGRTKPLEAVSKPNGPAMGRKRPGC